MLILKNRRIFVLFVALFAVFQASACSRSTVARDSSTAGRGSLEEQILFYTNRFRQSKGLKPLQLDATISQQARNHSKDMANGSTGFGHEGFEDRVAVISKKMGRVAGAAENVAYGTLDAESVVNGWIKSPGHRKNMLGDYTLIGIGAADKGRITFFTQVFIKQ
ncbi:CAP domain-containing protein [Chitinophaga silvatica]|uniref:CAP domain-containing protein n=1 Tax=Chitinophaga silvatica TaxID=2282649 RepID=A0A3E1YGG8_9BACT|nr:CAP domain-containing protein [Chitinophaga silvatica]RFS26462.1 CAP domain-containing protein [Chitinophaga silvatica]